VELETLRHVVHTVLWYIVENETLRHVVHKVFKIYCRKWNTKTRNTQVLRYIVERETLSHLQQKVFRYIMEVRHYDT
jgi:hypothetical protein